MRASSVRIMSLLLIVFICAIFTPQSAFATSEKPVSSGDKMDSDLRNVLIASEDDDVIPVAIWMDQAGEEERQDVTARVISNFDLMNTMDREEESILKSALSKDVDYEKVAHIARAQTRLILSRSVEKQILTQHNRNVLTALKGRYQLSDSSFSYTSRYAPLSFAHLTKLQIMDMADDPCIENIYYVKKQMEPDWDGEDYGGASATDYRDSSTPRSTDLPTYGYWQRDTYLDVLRDAHHYSGLGIKIGHIESMGVPEVYKSVFNYAYNNIHLVPSSFVYESHSSYTALLIVGNASDYDGAAPNAQLYCNAANSYYNDENGTITSDEAWIRAKIAAIDDIVDCEINILNASMYFGNAATYDYCSKYLDFLVHYFHVTICISSGNASQTGGTMYSGAAAYNVISVGNIDDNNTYDKGDDVIDDTVYLNSNALQYKPDICAPGERAAGPTAEGKIRGGGGTSAAAPIVSGICALLMEAEPDLISNPMMMKSILLSSATRIANMDHQTSIAYSTTPALSHSYGAGLVNALEAYYILTNNRLITYNENDWTGNTQTIDIVYRQKDLNKGRRIYASVSWEQEVERTNQNSYQYNESDYTVIGIEKYYIQLLDPNDNLVSCSYYAYDRKQVLGYQPTTAGTYHLIITRLGEAAHCSTMTASYNIPLFD